MKQDLETFGLIIGIFSGIIGIYVWLWPLLTQRIINLPVIIKLHASARNEDQHFVVWHSMALGIEARNVSRDIGSNIIHFIQSDESIYIDIPITGDDVIGGSHAPGPTVLTVSVPKKLKTGLAKICIEVNGRKSESKPIYILDEPNAPQLNGFGTAFASARSPNSAAGKRVAIGGFGFAINSDSNVISFVSDKSQVISKPAAVRGDALLGVVIPTGLSEGLVVITVYTLNEGKKIPNSNSLTINLVPPPRITRIDPYVRPGEDLFIQAENIHNRHESNIWVVLEPYQDRKPISLQAKLVPTEKDIIVEIPKNNIKPGPYDVRLIVDGNYSENSVILDIQNKSKRRLPEERVVQK